MQPPPFSPRRLSHRRRFTAYRGAAFWRRRRQHHPSYHDTDVMVSLCKLKNHITAGVTLSMKNLFGMTPNTLYGDKAGDENATAGRGPLHNPTEFPSVKLPGLKPNVTATDPTYRVPQLVPMISFKHERAAGHFSGCSQDRLTQNPWIHPSVLHPC